jgi:DNA (cytosine-5)-methyltransferase 1
VSRPKLLDLFSGAGGAAMGYHRAGFDVTGVDIRPQPRYPFAFVQGDALDFIREHGREYDAIHASPPCQAFTQMSARYRGKGGPTDDHPDLLTPTRAMLRAYRQPWIIENVPGAAAHMAPTISLHGGMFGLRVHRLRLFESNVLLLAPDTSWTRKPIGVYSEGPRPTPYFRNNGNRKGRSRVRIAESIEEARAVMGIDWMDWTQIKEAIPPAYTAYLGRQLMAYIGAEVMV